MWLAHNAVDPSNSYLKLPRLHVKSLSIVWNAGETRGSLVVPVTISHHKGVDSTHEHDANGIGSASHLTPAHAGLVLWDSARAAGRAAVADTLPSSDEKWLSPRWHKATVSTSGSKQTCYAMRSKWVFLRWERNVLEKNQQNDVGAWTSPKKTSWLDHLVCFLSFGSPETTCWLLLLVNPLYTVNRCMINHY